MDLFEMVIGIILILTIGSIIKARYGIRKDKWGNEVQVDDARTAAENLRLRDELRALKERVQVLERVITDNNRSLELDREIERLRDDNRV